MAALGSLQDNQKNSYTINTNGDVCQRTCVTDFDGDITVMPGATTYNVDDILTTVNEDTTTPSLTKALPVAIFQKNTVPTMFNVITGLSGVESSQALPADTKKFVIKARGNTRIQFAYSSGTTGTNYLTIEPGASYEDNNYYVAQTIYFQCNKATQTIEIITYS